jgi:geranylgeranyl diphosphate synthase, type I
MTAWLGEVRRGVERRLEAFFEAERPPLCALAPEAGGLIDAVRDLTLRGGKRFRPALLFAAYRAARPEGRLEEVVDAAAGLELLQSYLLIHDDWMDHDQERRGGPSTHAHFAARLDDAHLGASLAILAGNLACAQSWKLLIRGAAGRADALDAVLSMHEEVLVGQQLDVTAAEDVVRMQQLKTGSYTVKGPVALGAALAEASEAERTALLRYAQPLGEAFQMRDDLLGTFGDPAVTGKPSDDLQHGKRTALLKIAEERADDDALAPVRAVLGILDAPPEAVARAKAALESVGARAALEERLDGHVADAKGALAPLEGPGVAMLSDLADALARRSA